ncbi:MAG TPA: glycoside hydrolase family 3 N-terminal domain-containing protein, partial [Pyrinomonadaceae bacterium]|nr:glycoside hydrolase family 3 N-terminal domain-containing protein [Pyrinomonadaceae bacterium]
MLKPIRMNRAKFCAAVLGLCLCAALVFPNRPGVSAQRPTQTQIETRINDLISRMTLAEKLGQLQQLDGESDGNFRPEHLELVRKGLLGSTLNVRGAQRTNQLQRVAIEESRLKIPLLFGFDTIHGYRTVFPIPLAEAGSWDPSMAERSGAIAAGESYASGVRWTFAPMVDIARDPRWGRITEGAGEDPFLGAAFARARVRGFQGADYSIAGKILACAKHFVAYGAAEGGRDYNTTDISEYTLRSIYLPPFKAAVDAGVGTLMSAFNDLNGVPASANPFTLTKVLRGEWKFDGFVVSDYTAVTELKNHGLAANDADAAQAALNAGVDMEMVGRLYNQNGAELLKEGRLSQATIDEAVRRILRIKFRAGLFDHPYVDETLERSSLLTGANRAAAREIAGRSMVLLKNDSGTLPLSKNIRSLAVVGPLADNQRAPLGWWSGDGRDADTITPLAGIKAKVSAQTKISYVKGCEIEGGTTDGIAAAVAAAQQSDAAIVIVGEAKEMVGEGASRSSLDLPGNQLELVKAVQKTGKPTVVVLINGRPLTINWVAQNVPAILEAWMGGTESGNAIADILFGDVNPGGKLPVTFPRSVGQVPIYYNHMNTGRPPDAGVRWNSKYQDIPWTPLFPFGYGLSYTRFQLSNLRLSAPQLRPDGQLTVSVEVENTGQRAGDEVVQLYIRDLASSVTRPVRELKGFQRISLKPGQKKRLEFRLTSAELGFYNRENQFVVEPGDFKVFVGASSEGGLEA